MSARLFAFLFLMTQAAFAAPLHWSIFPELEILETQALAEGPYASMAAYRLAEAKAEKNAAKAQLWPSLSADVSATGLWEDRADVSDINFRERYSNNVSGSYPLFHWGAVHARAKTGRENYRLAKAQNKVEIASLRSRVRESYANIYLLRLQLAMLEEDIAGLKARTLSPPLEERSQLGYKELELNLEQALLNQKEMLSRQSAAHDALAELLGEEIALKFKAGELPEKLEVPVQWRAERPTNIDILTLKASAANETRRKTQYRSLALPRVDAIAGFYQDEVDSISSSDTVERNNYYAGVRVSWKFFDGFESKNLVAYARSRERRLKTEAAMREKRFEREYQASLDALERQSAAYGIALERLKIAQAKHKASQSLLQDGRSSSDSFSASKRAVDQATVECYQKLIEFLKNYEKIETNLELS